MKRPRLRVAFSNGACIIYHLNKYCKLFSQLYCEQPFCLSR